MAYEGGALKHQQVAERVVDFPGEKPIPSFRRRTSLPAPAGIQSASLSVSGRHRQIREDCGDYISESDGLPMGSE